MLLTNCESKEVEAYITILDHAGDLSINGLVWRYKEGYGKISHSWMRQAWLKFTGNSHLTRRFIAFFYHSNASFDEAWAWYNNKLGLTNPYWYGQRDFVRGLLVAIHEYMEVARGFSLSGYDDLSAREALCLNSHDPDGYYFLDNGWFEPILGKGPCLLHPDDQFEVARLNKKHSCTP